MQNSLSRHASYWLTGQSKQEIVSPQSLPPIAMNLRESKMARSSQKANTKLETHTARCPVHPIMLKQLITQGLFGSRRGKLVPLLILKKFKFTVPMSSFLCIKFL